MKFSSEIDPSLSFREFSRKPFRFSPITVLIFGGVFFGGLWLLTSDFRDSFTVSKNRAEQLKTLDREDDARLSIAPEWLDQYSLTVKTKEDLYVDADQDGLDLLGEYLYHTNPLEADTDRDGKHDGEEVDRGQNPNGSGIADTNENAIPDQWEKQYGLSLRKDESLDDRDGDGIVTRDEYTFGTNPIVLDSDGDGFSDGQEIRDGYDPSAPGDARPKVELFISKINVAVPIVLSEDTEDAAIEKDLERGAVLYPDTATPGQKGNAMITAHSSNYAWAPGAYNYIFRNLNDLEAGDTVKVVLTQQNGNRQEYTYRVDEKFVASPDDARIFAESEVPRATLVTCWPLNTTWKRLVVKTTLL
ncbi:MAG: sortase [Candidatus Moraniibacteriota bacterium]|nr:MAG: sortase [Candidatus Moranbacteria bacterium]